MYRLEYNQWCVRKHAYGDGFCLLCPSTHVVWWQTAMKTAFHLFSTDLMRRCGSWQQYHHKWQCTKGLNRVTVRFLSNPSRGRSNRKNIVRGYCSMKDSHETKKCTCKCAAGQSAWMCKRQEVQQTTRFAMSGAIMPSMALCRYVLKWRASQTGVVWLGIPYPISAFITFL